jgi:hypothetical protein
MAYKKLKKLKRLHRPGRRKATAKAKRGAVKTVAVSGGRAAAAFGIFAFGMPPEAIPVPAARGPGTRRGTGERGNRPWTLEG